MKVSSKMLSRKSKKRGAVTAELTIVVPLLAIFLVGLTEIGRLIQNVSWLTNTSYLAVRKGGEVATEMAKIEMPMRFMDLYGFENSQTKGFKQTTLDGTTDYHPADKTVSIGVDSTLVALFNVYPLNVNVKMVGPALQSNSTSVSSDLKVFGSPPSGCSYTCNGTQQCPGATNPNPCSTWKSVGGSAPVWTPGGGGGGGGGCLLAGTEIKMADGTTKAIEEVRRGDVVEAYNELTGQFEPGIVRKTSQRAKDSYYLINGSLRITEEHPLFADGRWVRVRDLHVGNELLRESGAYEKIVSIEKVEELNPVYNFSVDTFHSYVADGFVAHNMAVLDRVVDDCF